MKAVGHDHLDENHTCSDATGRHDSAILVELEGERLPPFSIVVGPTHDTFEWIRIGRGRLPTHIQLIAIDRSADR